MPASKSGSKKAGKPTGSRKKVRFIKGSQLSRSRKRASSRIDSGKPAPQRKSVQKSRKKTTRAGTNVSLTPGWKELNKARNSRHETASGSDSILEALSTVRFSLSVLAIAGVITLYVGHVHATQNLLSSVQEMRRENLSLHLRYNRIKGMYDRSTGPAVIYERARALDLEERMVTGTAIHITQ